jgi:hypothetical protein
LEASKMASELQNKANRLNAQKSTGPKTVEGKAAVAQNAVTHGLFTQQNVIHCENQADFDGFRDELVAGLKPVGGAEAMLAERIVSLSWRLKRVERMNSEAIDVMIARAETDSIDIRERSRAGLLDRETGRSELVLGWAMFEDFKRSQVLERLLMYEKRIESSLYKAMDELHKLQDMRKREQDEATKDELFLGSEVATHRGQDARETRGRDALDTKAATYRGQDARGTAMAKPSCGGRDALATEDGKGENKKQSQIAGLRPEIRSTKYEILNMEPQ